MQLECGDAQRIFARAKMNHAGYAAQTSGVRIGAVLTTVEFPAADRDLDAGNETMVATGAVADTMAMEHMFKVQESELGTLFMAANGDAVFNERGSLEALGSLATFGTGNLPIFDVAFPLDDELVNNEIRLTRIGGVEQTYSDATSIADYGLRTLTNTGLLLSSDIIVYTYCLYLLARYHDAKMRIKSFSVKPQADAATLWPLVLGIEIENKVTLVWTEASINGDYFIEGIEHSFDFRNPVWITKYQCCDADQYYYTPDPVDLIFRPDGVGTTTELTDIFPGGGEDNYEDVDEETADEDDSYVGKISNSAYVYDTYTMESPAIQAGTINSVIIHFRAKRSAATVVEACAVIRTYATDYEDWANHVTLTEDYTDYTSGAWIVNPNTGDPFTWAELNALEAGALLSMVGVNTYGRVTQVWAVANVTPAW